MKIFFTIPGSFKDANYRDLAQMYAERASRFASLSCHELKLGKNDPAAEERALELFLEKHPRAPFVILDERGKLFASREFSKKLSDLKVQGVSEIVIALGGAHGYSEALRKRALFLWSLSPMIMAHELAAVVALEQIYRALSIEAGHPYHNE